jgi:hypothetical membrane protein
MIAPPVAFTFILLAIAFFPHFSWSGNALSDLGVTAGPTMVLFNSGLIVSGILALFFALGLFVIMRSNWLGGVGTITFIFDSLALIAIGVFPENVRPMHIYASVAFFVLFPVSMFFLTASFLLSSDVKKGLLTLSAAVFAVGVWIAEFLWRYVPGAAIPETLSVLSASFWVVILGFDMVRDVSYSSD